MRIAQLILGTVLTVGVGVSQTTVVTEPDQTTLSGTAASSSPHTLTVKTDANLYQLFVIDRFTAKPQSIPLGSEVTVVSVPTTEPGVRLARIVTVRGSPAAEKPAQPAAPGQPAEPAQPTPPAPPKEPAPVPTTVRKLEGDIERQSKRFGLGFRTGIGMDPEVLLVGLQAKMGPIFTPNISFRPSVEFGFGEVTKLFAVNLDAGYRLPLTPRWSSWSAYVGGGPSLNFSHQNFNPADTGIDFGDFSFTAGLDLLTGLEFRRGFMVEAKATLYAAPNPSFRIMFGYTF